MTMQVIISIIISKPVLSCDFVVVKYAFHELKATRLKNILTD